MKLVISTQIRENYGAHDWDGTGECPQHWKCKGGDVYVVPGITVEHADAIKLNGIPTLTSLIEFRNHSAEEYVAEWSVLDDDSTVCDPWDTPFNLFWENGRWIARRTVENGEYGYMNRAVASKIEEYEMSTGGQRVNYTVTYTMRNGDVVSSEDVGSYLQAA